MFDRVERPDPVGTLAINVLEFIDCQRDEHHRPGEEWRHQTSAPAGLGPSYSTKPKVRIDIGYMPPMRPRALF